MEILTEKLDSSPNTAEKGLPRIKDMACYIPGRKMLFGDIGITPFFVDHSALDAYMFLLEAGGKKILFTGDFREHGIAGRNDRFERMLRKYIGEVDILITEGTMLSRTEETNKNPIQTEDDLGNRARELFRENKESVILVSSTNLDSTMKFYHAVPWGMDFVCDAYQARLILAAMADKGSYHEYRPELIHGKPRRLYIIGDMEGLGAAQNCCRANFSILKNKGFTMLTRENKTIFKQKMEEHMIDPLVIYSNGIGFAFYAWLHVQRSDPFPLCIFFYLHKRLAFFCPEPAHDFGILGLCFYGTALGIPLEYDNGYGKEACQT